MIEKGIFMADFEKVAPKTVADMGIEVSRAYAENAERYDSSFIKDSMEIPHRTESLTLHPSFVRPEFLGEKEKSTWADFPPSIAVPSKFVFGDQLIPGLDVEQLKQTITTLPKPEDNESRIVSSFIERTKKIEELLRLSNHGRRQFLAG